MAKEKVQKTNAMRLLDAAGIDYSMASYDYDESDLSGVHAAQELGVSEDVVFKTLVTRGDGNAIFVFVIPVAESLDLKKAAHASGNKKIEMILDWSNGEVDDWIKNGKFEDWEKGGVVYERERECSKAYRDTDRLYQSIIKTLDDKLPKKENKTGFSKIDDDE